MTEIKTVSEYKTAKGRNCSHFTLKCRFFESAKYKDPKFTYRGDTVLRKMREKQKDFKNQLEALEFQAELIMASIKEAILYDNSFEAPHNIVKKWVNGNLLLDFSGQYKWTSDGFIRNIPVVDEEQTKTKIIAAKKGSAAPAEKKKITPLKISDEQQNENFRKKVSAMKQINSIADNFKIKN